MAAQFVVALESSAHVKLDHLDLCLTLRAVCGQVPHESMPHVCGYGLGLLPCVVGCIARLWPPAHADLHSRAQGWLSVMLHSPVIYAAYPWAIYTAVPALAWDTGICGHIGIHRCTGWLFGAFPENMGWLLGNVETQK